MANIKASNYHAYFKTIDMIQTSSDGENYRCSFLNNGSFIRLYDRFIKVIINNKVSNGAIRLLFHILSKLERNGNVITLSNEEVCEVLNVKYRQAYNIIRELVKLDCINPCENKNEYVINHNYIFKGDLNEFAKQFIEAVRNKTDCDEISKDEDIIEEYKRINK